MNDETMTYLLQMLDDDTPSVQAHQRGQRLPQRCLGSDVTVSNSSKGNDGPINALWNTGETVFLALDEVNQSTKDHRNDKYTT